jgi:hypothetical protein
MGSHVLPRPKGPRPAFVTLLANTLLRSWLNISHSLLRSILLEFHAIVRFREWAYDIVRLEAGYERTAGGAGWRDSI